MKIYGLSCPKVVKEIVDDFFRSKKKINSQNLLNLENKVKRESLKNKSKTTKNPKKTEKNPKIEKNRKI